MTGAEVQNLALTRNALAIKPSLRYKNKYEYVRTSKASLCFPRSVIIDDVIADI